MFAFKDVLYHENDDEEEADLKFVFDGDFRQNKLALQVRAQRLLQLSLNILV